MSNQSDFRLNGEFSHLWKFYMDALREYDLQSLCV